MLYVLTVVHNRCTITTRFVENLKKQTFKDYKLLLVDDGSSDGTSNVVLDILPDTTVLYGNGNLWWGGGLHKGYKWLKTNATENDVVFICNDDTLLDENYLLNALRIINADSEFVLTGCGYSINSRKLIDGAVNFDYSTGICKLLEPGRNGNCASTRSIFIPWKVFKKVGGFHPVLLPHYASDYEFTMRIYRKGFEIKSVEELKYTFDEGTTGIKDKSKLTLMKVFCKRSIYNPFYKFNFIFLATPSKYLFSHLRHQFTRYIKQIKAKSLLSERTRE